jgi:DNA repair exonuclease SbcCD ATPase subunit
MSNETQDVEALDRLESRVLEMVEQLRETKRQLAAAEQESSRLREKLSQAESRAQATETDRARARAGQDEIRRRIETLIGRIESMEQ